MLFCPSQKRHVWDMEDTEDCFLQSLLLLRHDGPVAHGTEPGSLAVKRQSISKIEPQFMLKDLLSTSITYPNHHPHRGTCRLCPGPFRGNGEGS